MLKSYNRIDAAAYAQKWALSANPDFYHFGGIGGDCTNFVSQCLLAGGGVMNYSQNGWFYKNLNDRSPSWTGVGPLLEFILRKNESVGPVGEIVTLSELEIGDIIQLRQNPTHFNHTLIVSLIKNDKIFVCAHSYNELNKPLDEYFFNSLLPVHIKGVNV